MEYNCAQCNGEAERIPGGISRKTNKPYNARIQCKNSECNAVSWLKDDKGGQAPKTPQKGSSVSNTGDVLNRLAMRLESIDLNIKHLAEEYGALSAFFRSEQNDKPGVDIKTDKEWSSVPVSRKFSKQLPTQENPEE